MSYYNANLLTETMDTLHENGITNPANEVRFVSAQFIGEHPEDFFYQGVPVGPAISIGWQLFTTVAERTLYDAGYGLRVINRSLIIAGDGWWMERAEYDGSEWWEFKRYPKQPLIISEDPLEVEELLSDEMKK